ncbi:DUF1189 domain-containing protein [Bacillus sp. PS06]|uniref:DUF1189 domain-containing protein n=1 Tax=Bacillus sp. PS06 TaxID=2764176 RepID=UPI001784BF6C|nr:DUF1189 domain-containing protein [Bacillus sp. PS06]MBD8069160.1 DUF1189 domain-containing protein [Bacillus sp. PS06]
MSIFNQFLKSLYSPKDVVKYRFQGIGKTILFVFLLALLSLLPAAISMSEAFSSAVKSLDSALSDASMPSFEISNGALTTTATEPYIVEHGEFTIIVDGTSSLNANDVDQYGNALAFLSTGFIISSQHQAERIDYTLLEGTTITNAEISTYLETLISALPIIVPIMLIIMYIVTSGIKFIEVSVAAIIGLAIRNILKLNLKYRHTWIIAAYSMTIPTLFFMLMDLLQINVPYAGSINWFVITFLMYLALKEIPRKKEIN